MTHDNHISGSQLFCVLLLSRISAEIVYPHAEGTASESIIAVIAAEIIRFALALPVIIYSFKGNGIYGAILKKNSFLGWASAVISSLILLGFCIGASKSTAEFARQSLIPGTNIAVIYIILFAFAIFAAYIGIEGMARAGVLFLVAAAIITITVILADIPYMEWNRNFSADNPDNILSMITARILGGGEYLLFAALLPYVRFEKKKISGGKPILFFALSGCLISVLLCGFYSAVLGEFYALAKYPFTAAASLSDISLFKRLDGASGAIWSLCAALRCGLFLFGAYAAVMQTFKKQKPAESSA